MFEALSFANAVHEDYTVKLSIHSVSGKEAQLFFPWPPCKAGQCWQLNKPNKYTRNRDRKHN